MEKILLSQSPVCINVEFLPHCLLKPHPEMLSVWACKEREQNTKRHGYNYGSCMCVHVGSAPLAKEGQHNSVKIDTE